MFVMLSWTFVIHCCTLIHLGPKLSTMHACCVHLAEFPNEIPSFPQNCFSLFKFLRIHNHFIHSYTTFIIIMLLMHDDNHDSILFSFLVHCHCISMHVYNSVRVRNYVQYRHRISATVTTLCARTLQCQCMCIYMHVYMLHGVVQFHLRVHLNHLQVDCHDDIIISVCRNFHLSRLVQWRQ